MDHLLRFSSSTNPLEVASDEAQINFRDVVSNWNSRESCFGAGPLLMGGRMTCLLALDTSTQGMSLALIIGGDVLVYDGVGGGEASGQLIPQAQQLMAQAGLIWSQLDAIAFGRGPGAFTGLRTACSVAQGLALGADRPVLPLDSLMVVAQDACEMMDAPSTWVVTDARMGEVYAAQYRWCADEPLPLGMTGCWRVLTEPLLSTPEAMLSRWSDRTPTHLAGNALLAFSDAFSDAKLPGVRLFPRAQIRGHALAAVALQAWACGGAVDAALALPLYVRDKVAQTMAEREQIRLAAAGPT